ETAVAVAKEYGIGRAAMLNVAGAYHSRLMDSAYNQLEKALADVPIDSPRFPVISNVTGEEVKTPEQIRETLRDQVTGTVRWTDCMQRLLDLGCDFFIELGAGNVLAGLLKRSRRRVDVISIADADSVRKCSERISTSN
ncbi:MAG: ACP S-malonyltransferase, partial [Alphaproteobacteria bacterium]